MNGDGGKIVIYLFRKILQTKKDKKQEILPTPITILDRLLAASQPEKINTDKPVIFIVDNCVSSVHQIKLTLPV
jgi:hypothetical protein